MVRDIAAPQRYIDPFTSSASGNPYLDLYTYVMSIPGSIVRPAAIWYREWQGDNDPLAPRRFTETHPSMHKGLRRRILYGNRTSYLDYRRTMQNYYAWAIPTAQALTRIAGGPPILEVGAGTGYWARLIREHGGDIIATDLQLPNRRHPFHTGTEVFSPVYQLDGVEAVRAWGRNRRLMLCWPPFDTPMAGQILTAYHQIGGESLIFIGEGRYGATGDDAFHAALETQWEPSGHMTLPRWGVVHDGLQFYERRA